MDILPQEVGPACRWMMMVMMGVMMIIGMMVMMGMMGMMVMMTSSLSCHPLHLQWLQAEAGVLAVAGRTAPGARSDKCRLLLPPLRGCLPPVVAGGPVICISGATCV